MLPRANVKYGFFKDPRRADDIHMSAMLGYVVVYLVCISKALIGPKK